MAKVGRPSKYTEELADEICERIADGEPLRAICRDPHMPSKESVRRWRDANEEFRARYARARMDSADSHVDRIADNADRLERATTMVEVQGLKEATQARKWLAEVTKPKEYGQLQKLEHSGAGGAPLKITIERPGEGDE